MSKSNRLVKIAGIQMKNEIGNKEKNINKAVCMIDKAAKNGSQIIGLQELFNTEYVCFCKKDPRTLNCAESIPGPTIDRIAEKAKEYGIYIIAPIFEKAAPGLYYNTAALIGPDGSVIGKQRKTHIPAALPRDIKKDMGSLEKLYFRPGNEFHVFKTKLCNIGIIICADGRYPETFRILALEGAEIIFRPSAISVSDISKQHNAAERWTMMNITRADDNGVFVVGINRVGVEERCQYYGTTLIISPYGEILAKGGEKEDEVVSAIIDLNQVGRDGRIFRDYRPELYHRLTNPPKG